MKESKRNFLKIGLSAIALGVSSKAVAVCTGAATAKQPSGPFYPENDQADKDNDLTWVKGGVAQAEGEIIIINGVVQDTNCMPVEGSLVEIWQACHTGKYNHSADPNNAELDENFQYWGKAITNSKGEYSFRTIMPGAYPASANWIRPSHIHARIQKRGYEELTTQIYFKNSEYLETDNLYLSIPPGERESVVVDLKENIEGIREGDFNITVNKVRGVR